MRAPRNSAIRAAGATEMNAEVVCLASWNADLVSHLARAPARGETVLAHGFEVSPGGKGSNAAVACARQGARVALLARIGADDFGRMALALWAREGVDASMVEQVAGQRMQLGLVGREHVGQPHQRVGQRQRCARRVW